MSKEKIRRMVETAVLMALILVLSFTPLGYLKIGTVSITFIMIPVAIGAIMEGPGTGAFLGMVFGATSFIQCFGMDAFGTTLLGINPVFTFITCMVPRVLMGWLCGWIFRWLRPVDKNGIVGSAVASLSGAVLNTVLFISFLLLFFGSSEYIQNFGINVWEILTVLFVINAAVEAAVCLVVGTAVSVALLRTFKR